MPSFKTNTVDSGRFEIQETELKVRFIEVSDLTRVRIIEGKNVYSIHKYVLFSLLCIYYLLYIIYIYVLFIYIDNFNIFILKKNQLFSIVVAINDIK